MKISIISFTNRGQELSRKLRTCLEEFQVQLFTKCSSCLKESQDVTFVEQSIGEWTKGQMDQKNALIFVGACGIAVRAIAPNVVGKLEDSPVIVIDEKGKYVIPILSGHFGGANELAAAIAEKMGAEPVITTATDVNQKFAVDLFAKRNGLHIENKEGIAQVSSKVLRGESVKIAIEEGHLIDGKGIPKEVELTSYPPMEKVDVVVSSENRVFDAKLVLRPREYVIGTGCRRGKDAEIFEYFIEENLKKAGVTIQQVFALASIDIKSEELAIKNWTQKNRVPFYPYGREELEAVEGAFEESDFVKKTVGVGNVCERAALKVVGNAGELIMEKYAEDGMTIAIAKRRWGVTFDEE